MLSGGGVLRRLIAIFGPDCLKQVPLVFYNDVLKFDSLAVAFYDLRCVVSQGPPRAWCQMSHWVVQAFAREYRARLDDEVLVPKTRSTMAVIVC